jgi:hypothetical protein
MIDFVVKRISWGDNESHFYEWFKGVEYDGSRVEIEKIMYIEVWKNHQYLMGRSI